MKRTKFPLTALAALAAILLNGSVRAEDEAVINEGEDITRPLARFDFKAQYLNLPPAGNDNSQITTLRVDKPFVLATDWQLAARFDLPVYITDAVSSDNPNGHTNAGLGDVLLQGLVVHSPADSRFAWAVGPRLDFPTASEDQMGTGKWRIVSTAGARYFTPEISKGSWVGLVARYAASFAGNSDRNHISELQLAPQVYIQLPDTWFLNFYPATDIRYNFAARRSGDTGRWFVPLDVVVGRMLTESIIASFEVGVPIVNQYKVYDLKLEARIGYFF